ncbi:hypothetical protein [uncultured Aquimarina sp.]|uniref:hypothetical protein n=1 Tax=uncultured Aquimarina sp. TaxID=575652 RepID=UPI002614419A|nr:hypothetical protein [uncultured Aquimarina sp.]
MRALLFITSILFLFYACVPTKIAPNIKEDKVMVAKKFKKGLPKRNSFIFEDPKNANEFYQYINQKFKLNDEDVQWNVPFTVNDAEYYLSFYEVERSTKTINLAPLVIDAALEQNDHTPVLEELYTSRSGKWYVVLTINDKDFMDPLKENYPNRDEIVKFLKQLRKEYLSTSHYKSLFFKK